MWWRRLEASTSCSERSIGRAWPVAGLRWSRNLEVEADEVLGKIRGALRGDADPLSHETLCACPHAAFRAGRSRLPFRRSHSGDRPAPGLDRTRRPQRDQLLLDAHLEAARKIQCADLPQHFLPA